MNPSFLHSEKADLHVHLSGAIPPTLVRELVAENGIQVPQGFDLLEDLTIKKPVLSMLDYFKPWSILKQLPRGKLCLDRMIDAAVREASNDGVKFVEFRHSVSTMSATNGIHHREALEWLVDGLASASSKHKVKSTLIVSFSRYKLQYSVAEELMTAIGDTEHGGLIVGVDLTGNEDEGIPDGISRLFRETKDRHGIGVTIHCGETGVAGNIWWAVKECGADRVGHALAAIKDDDLLDYMAKNRICVETCLTSNLLTGKTERLKDHPVITMRDRGVPFVICTDNPAIHSKALSDEYVLYADLVGDEFSPSKMFEEQMKYAFSR